MRRRRRSQAGVTLIEMLVVVTIMGLFAFFVLPKFMGQADKAKRTAARSQIASYVTALSAYKLDTGTFPTTEYANRPRPADCGLCAYPSSVYSERFGNDRRQHR